MKSLAHSCFHALTQLIFPSCCVFCKCILDTRAIFCQSCFHMIRPVVSHSLFITRNRSMTVFAISDYKDPIRSLILAKRRADILSSYDLGNLVCDLTVFNHVPADYIIPIPLHWTRYAARGFNQAEEMACVMAKRRNLPVAHMLKRVKKTKFQADLDAKERQINVAEAFELAIKNPEIYRGKHLVLVDDLMTTGSTFQSAARVLLQLKPATISGIVAARVV